MKLSILDQSPIAANQTAQEALLASTKLAQAGEAFGYTRYWIAEHHDLRGLACPAPEVMISYIGAQTERIRLGSGAILLPHYKPFKVAETFNLLATLFPNRIDIGLGRAPGGSSEAMVALSGNFIQNVGAFPTLVKDLLHFLDDDYPLDNPHATLSASPIPNVPPMPWLLGTGKKSAILASQYGLPYAFGHFMSDEDGAAVIRQYRETFQARRAGDTPHVIVSVGVICAETNARAEEVALSYLVSASRLKKGRGIPSIEEAKQVVLTEQEQATFDQLKQQMIIGNPQHVKEELARLQAHYDADEMMLNTITYALEDRIASYRYIAEAMWG